MAIQIGQVDPAARRAPAAPRQYRYYDFFMAAYVCILLCANLIGPAKVSTIHVPLLGDITFMAGVLFFPLSYIFGDILTEVYGYAPRPPRGVGRLRSTGLRLGDGQRHRRTAAVGAMARQAGRGRDHIRQHAAHRGRLDHRLLVRLVRQQLRDGQDEDLEQRALAVDPHRRLDAVRRGWSTRRCSTRSRSTASWIPGWSGC